MFLSQGIDVGHKQRKVIRRDPKSKDPYILLLVKVSKGSRGGWATEALDLAA